MGARHGEWGRGLHSAYGITLTAAFFRAHPQAKWTTSLALDDLEQRQEQLNRYFTMLFSWGERSNTPLLESQAVQAFVIQEGDLPAPDLPPNKAGKLKHAHLLNKQARGGASHGGESAGPMA